MNFHGKMQVVNDSYFWNRATPDVVISSSPSESGWSPGGSPTGCSSSAYNDYDPADKKERHKLVERNRRDKTRAFVQELQSMLPNVSDKSANPNINVILENTLEYLQSVEVQKVEENEEDTDSTDATPSSMESTRDQLVAALSGSPYDDTASRRYMYAFQHSPVGIVIARVDGAMIAANLCFENFFKFARGSLKGSTMFSLTAQPDLPKVMQV
jgi:hypothetical protein